MASAVQFGNAQNGSSVTAAAGGTAAAGDLMVMLTAGGFDGAGLDLPTITDDGSDGGAGWTLEADNFFDSGTDEWRCIVWTKICVGGEAHVTMTVSGGANLAMSLGWFQNPGALPYLYVIDEGLAPWDGVSENSLVAPPGSVNGNGQLYMTLMGAGRPTPVAYNDMPPNGTSGASYSLSDAVNTIVFAYGNPGTTADQLNVANHGTDISFYVVFFGITDTPPTPVAHLAGDGTFGLGGTGELETTETLAGEGTFGLGGTGTLEVSGGDLHLAGEGTFGLGGVGRLIAPFPHPVPGPADRSDLLECGRYDAMVFTRGLGEIVGRLPFGELDWSRVLDGVSSAGLTVDGVANRSQLQRCCALMGEVEPFEHELAIYRNGYRVWSGPITSLAFPPNQIQVSAFDLSGWLQLRTLHENLNAVGVDLADIWVNYVQDAMSVDNSPGLQATVLALSGILADRLTQITEHNVALDAIAELARTGLDWTTVDRVMQAGPVLTQPPPIADALEFPLLIDSSFRVAPTIMLDGTQGANCWYVQGGGAGPAGAVVFGEYGPAFPATPDHVAQDAAPDYAAIEDQYGRIEKVANESRVLDQPSIDANAASRYDLTKRPVAVISEGLLLPSAPIAMRKLVPGSLVQVHLSSACKPIGDLYRIKTVKVTANGDGSEDVNVEFQPLGTGLVLGTGDA